MLCECCLFSCVMSLLLFRQDQWSMGKKRSFSQYMEMVGIETKSKKVTPNVWCHKGEWPEIAKQYMVKKEL